jgi:hypothetical protein
MIVVIARHLFGIGMSVGDIAGAVAGMDDAGLKPGIGGMCCRKTFGQCHAFQGKCPELARHIEANEFFQRVLVEPLAGADLPAIAPRSPPANPMGVEQDDVIALFGQMQRRRQSGEPGTNDADVASKITRSCRVGVRWCGTVGIPGPGVFPGPVIGIKNVHGGLRPI